MVSKSILTRSASVRQTTSPYFRPQPSLPNQTLSLSVLKANKLMRIAKQIATIALVIGTFPYMPRTLQAQNDPIAAIQQKVTQTIVPAKLAGNGDILVAGSVMVLQKDGLQMSATSAPAAAGAPANTYKNGKLSAGMFVWRLGLSLAKIDENTIPQRKLVAGEKFWVVSS